MLTRLLPPDHFFKGMRVAGINKDKGQGLTCFLLTAFAITAWWALECPRRSAGGRDPFTNRLAPLVDGDHSRLDGLGLPVERDIYHPVARAK